MTQTPSDVDARFDRTIDRWFRDQLDDAAGVRDLLRHPRSRRRLWRRGVATPSTRRWPSTVARSTSCPPSIPAELSAERALDRDLAIHQARLGLYWQTEYRPWAGSSGGAAHIGEALFPLFTRDFAPLADRLESIASGSTPLPVPGRDARARHRAGEAVDRDRPRVDRAHAVLPRHDPGRGPDGGRETTALADRLSASVDADEGRPGGARGLAAQLTCSPGRRPTGRPVPSASRRWFASASSRPMATRSWRSARSCSSPRRRRAMRSPRRSIRRASLSGVADIVKDDHAATLRRVARRVPRRDGSCTCLRGRARHRDAARGRSPQRHRDADVHPPSHPVRGLLRAGEVRPAPGRDLHRHAALVAADDARAQPRLDQQHVRPRGVPRPPPPAERGDHQSQPGAPVLGRARSSARDGPSTASG